LQVAALRGARVDFDQKSPASRLLNNEIEAHKPRQTQAPDDFFYSIAHLRILNESYHSGRSVGTSRLEDNGRNLRQDFALPTR